MADANSSTHAGVLMNGHTGGGSSNSEAPEQPRDVKEGYQLLTTLVESDQLGPGTFRLCGVMYVYLFCSLSLTHSLTHSLALSAQP
jgi:hypothetical protein